MSTVETQGVWHRYPHAFEPALVDASVYVRDGQMVSVVGPSGSGKSTLLRVVAGLQRADRGRVLIDGVDVDGVPIEGRDLTVMFQSPLLFDHLDVAGNVGFAPRVAGAGRREARRCASRYLRLVGLAGMESRPVASLSGGQQQRVALARALAAERGVLLLDEPFSSLDRELRGSMHDLLTEVRAALAPTILMVTHDLDEAALADSTVVLIDGTIHQQAPTHELYRRPASLDVARLLGGFTEVPGTVHGGVHHSSWGRLPLDPGAPASGRATLLLRRETLGLRPEDSAARAAGGDPEVGVPGRVVRRRQHGTRVVVGFDGDDGTRVEVELPPGADAPLGSRARVVLADDVRSPWAVPHLQASGGAGKEAHEAPGSRDSGHEARSPLEESRS